MKEKQLTTEIWGLNFFLKGKRMCFVTRTPQGVETRYWTDISPKTLTVLSKRINDYLLYKEAEAKLTPQQLAEKYQETCGT